jgi:hypothetical protein|tara:strand:- start:292 stop:906 length:615 start_codon:yes stop_codon:yes gene_type:complete
MIEQLLGLIKENSQHAVVQNPQIPNQQNEEVMQTLLSSITGGIQDQAQSGNIQGILGLLSGKDTKSATNGIMDNPIVGSIANNAIGAIMKKFGLDSSVASGIVASVLPGVLSSLISKVSNPNDSSIDFNGVLGSLLGKNQTGADTSTPKGFDFNQVGYAMADGKLDMNDIINIGSSFLGGNSKKPSQQDGGLDIGGMLGGLFGK